MLRVSVRGHRESTVTVRGVFHIFYDFCHIFHVFSNVLSACSPVDEAA